MRVLKIVQRIQKEKRNHSIIESFERFLVQIVIRHFFLFFMHASNSFRNTRGILTPVLNIKSM